MCFSFNFMEYFGVKFIIFNKVIQLLNIDYIITLYINEKKKGFISSHNLKCKEKRKNSS